MVSYNREYKLVILSQNVRGLHNKQKRRKLFNWFETMKADIILLQETFCTQNSMPLFKSDWKGLMFNACSDSNHSRGVAVLFKSSLHVKIISTHTSSDGRNIIVNFEYNDTTFSAVSVYAPNSENERIQYLIKLEDWIKEFALGIENLIIGGDFNCTLPKYETAAKNHIRDKSKLYVEKLINNLHCTDIFGSIKKMPLYLLR